MKIICLNTECGILVRIDGPLHKVIKIKPMMVFSETDADLFIRRLDKLLIEDFLSGR